MSSNRRISTLSQQIKANVRNAVGTDATDIDDLTKLLGEVSLKTTPKNPNDDHPARPVASFNLPSNARRDVGQWYGGIVSVVFNFNRAYMSVANANGTVETIPITPHTIHRWNRGRLLPHTLRLVDRRTHYGATEIGVELNLPDPNSTRGTLHAYTDMQVHVEYLKPFGVGGGESRFQEKTYLSDREFMEITQNSVNVNPFGHIVLSQMELVHVRCAMRIDGPPINMSETQRRLGPACKGGEHGLTWKSERSAYDAGFSVDFTNHASYRTTYGYIIVHCDAKDRRFVCGMAAQAAWGVGGGAVM